MLRYLLMFGMCLSTQIFGDVEFNGKVKHFDSFSSTADQNRSDCNMCPRGPRGPRGDRGCRGHRGPRGANGVNGENGLDNEVTGPTGPTGITGAPGAGGATGATGINTIGPGFVQAAYNASLTGPLGVAPGDHIIFDAVNLVGDGSITPTTPPTSVIALPPEPGIYLVTFGVALRETCPAWSDTQSATPAVISTFTLVLTDPPTGTVSVPGGALSFINPVLPRLESITTIVSVKAISGISPTLSVINDGLTPVNLGGLPSHDTSAYITIIKLN